MNLITPLRILMLLGLLAAGSSRAQGFLDWQWSFDQSQFTVGPSDSIELTGTISLRPEAPGPITGRAIFSFSGTLFKYYDFDCAFCRDSRLADVNIPPGGSLHFDFGTLVPKASVTPGTYRNLPDQPLIEFEALGIQHIPVQNLVIEVVPEPSTSAISMLGIGLLYWTAFHRGRLEQPVKWIGA